MVSAALNGSRLVDGAAHLSLAESDRWGTQELRGMFRIPGIEPDGVIEANEGIRNKIVHEAKVSLGLFLKEMK
jgi:hypothetical protein